MSAGVLFGKRTWIGCGISLGLLILLLLLGSLLIVRGILPMKMGSSFLWVSYGIAAFVGGSVAAVGQERHICAIMPGVMIYVLAWLFALCSECTIDFAANGLGITIAVCAGMLTAFVCRKGRRKSRSKKVKRPMKRTIRR